MPFLSKSIGFFLFIKWQIVAGTENIFALSLRGHICEVGFFVNLSMLLSVMRTYLRGQVFLNILMKNS
jgi:hypothetical protein